MSFGRTLAVAVAVSSALAEARPIELRAEVGSEAAAIPFTTLGHNVNPSGLIGAGWHWKKWPHLALVQSVNLEGFSHLAMQWGVAVGSELGLRVTAWALVAELSLGAGYLHVFSGAAQYAKDPSGAYRQVRDWGTPRGDVSAHLAVGVDLSRFSPLPLTLAVRYGFLLELMDFGGLVLPHTTLAIGVRYALDWGSP